MSAWGVARIAKVFSSLTKEEIGMRFVWPAATDVRRQQICTRAQLSDKQAFPLFSSAFFCVCQNREQLPLGVLRD